MKKIRLRLVVGGTAALVAAGLREGWLVDGGFLLVPGLEWFLRDTPTRTIEYSLMKPT